MTLRPPLEVLLGSALGLYAATSLLWSRADPIYPSLYLASLVLAGGVGYRLGTLRGVWFGCCIAVTLNVLITPIFIYGLFGNPNVFGCALALCLASALVFNFYWFLPFAAYGLFHCESRGALAGAGVACLLGLYRRFPTTAICLGLASIALVTGVKSGSGSSLLVRMGIWQDTLNHLAFFGRGWGSFAYDYIAFYKHTNATLLYASHAYNDALELIFELGVFSTIALWLFVLALEADHTHRLILLTYAALSLTFFPLYIPFVGHMVVFTLASALRQTRSYRYGSLASRSPSLP